MLKARLGDISLQTLAYGEPLRIGDVTVSFHPAGHVLGSAQVRVEHRGEVWVASGDYKTQPDPTCAPFEYQWSEGAVVLSPWNLSPDLIVAPVVPTTYQVEVRCSQLPRPSACGLRSREHSIGDRVSATTPEIVTAPTSVNANSVNSAPVSPPWKPIGM